MKIKTKRCSYDEVMALPAEQHRRPTAAWPLFPKLVRLLSKPELAATNFSCKTEGLERAGQGPYLILMNHSCFTDLMIAFEVLRDIPFNIVCTTDAMVGKGWLMRALGCFPTEKFVSDLSLIRDILYVTGKLGRSVLLYPEAGYSFDGTATTLPEGLGAVLKKLGLPVLTLITEGAYSRQPLYNNLKKRKVNISATFRCLFSREEIQDLPAQRIQQGVEEAFSFDAFAWQKQTGTRITEPDRAEGLERVLYKCPCCGSEFNMESSGAVLRCKSCGTGWTLSELGELLPDRSCPVSLTQVPQWFRWQREQVRQELEAGSYRLQIPVDIAMLVDHKALYQVGEGELLHDHSGFRLEGCGGALQYSQSPQANYTLNSDFFWYEMGDIIGIGRKGRLYYCFTQERGVVTKARLATEELYKLTRKNKES